MRTLVCSSCQQQKSHLDNCRLSLFGGVVKVKLCLVCQVDFHNHIINLDLNNKLQVIT